jgi:hypothetical protein
MPLIRNLDLKGLRLHARFFERVDGVWAVSSFNDAVNGGASVARASAVRIRLRTYPATPKPNPSVREGPVLE